MTHAKSTRRSAYHRTLDTVSSEARRICRATSYPARAAMHAANAEGSEPAPDWLSVFETELEEALADYEERRTSGRDTAELADYIGYLDACVAQLIADPRFAALTIGAVTAIEDLDAVAARRGLAPAYGIHGAEHEPAGNESDRTRLRGPALE